MKESCNIMIYKYNINMNYLRGYNESIGSLREKMKIINSMSVIKKFFRRKSYVSEVDDGEKLIIIHSM
jgi:hypothetical protein